MKEGMQNSVSSRKPFRLSCANCNSIFINTQHTHIQKEAERDEGKERGGRLSMWRK